MQPSKKNFESVKFQGQKVSENVKKQGQKVPESVKIFLYLIDKQSNTAIFSLFIAIIELIT